MFLSRMCLKLGRCPGNPGSQCSWRGVCCGERVVCVCDTVAVGTMSEEGRRRRSRGCMPCGCSRCECAALVPASGECDWNGERERRAEG